VCTGSRRGLDSGRIAENAAEDHDSPLSPLDQARRIAALAQEKLAEDVVILDMRPVCTYTDFFVICTGRNPRQTAAIWDEVHEKLKQEGAFLPQSVDGQREGTWIVADYVDVVLHVFTPETRAFYRLDDLWGDVPSIEPEAVAG
jgi:ribosome-associated protein